MSQVTNPPDKTLSPPTAGETTAWYALEAAEVLGKLSVNPETGLSEAEAKARLEQYGLNELVEKGMTSPWAILWEQLTAPLVLLLIGAAVISAVLGKIDSVIAIMAIVIINAILGLVQEYRAEQAMAALKKMAAPAVRVRRDGRLVDISSPDLVPGDVVVLEAGNIIPADARLFESANLRIQEASLTGESLPVDKFPQAITKENPPLGDRFNMTYMGTAVTYGRGAAVVIGTGMKTELGRIAELIQSAGSEETPLQRRMAELGKTLIIMALSVMVIAVIVGLITGQSFLPDPANPDSESVLLNGVAIAVAVVPEGLPAVVTVCLALGAQRMLRRRALIRKLPAVETLGSVTVICSDKTGTLTENKMTVTTLDVSGRNDTLKDVLRQDFPSLVSANGSGEPHGPGQALLLAGSTLCNDAVLERNPEAGVEDFRIIGDPTEGALVAAAQQFGLVKSRLETVFPRVGEAPFSSERRRMTTIHRVDNQPHLSAEEQYLAKLFQTSDTEFTAFTKGSVDGLLDVSSQVYIDGKVQPITPELRKRVETANNNMAKDGLRVLGLAYRSLDQVPTEEPENVEQELTFVGMIGMIDPPRAEVRQAVLTCLHAGIRPVMITGDHPLTALNIAKQLHITDNDRVLTGQDLSKMSQAELEAAVKEVSVYARVSPENKLGIVQALQNNGNIVAMTGDGVNDAPALRRSEIGVAMGITGTAVSKEASDMVILDDNFATIVSAVEEGRTIYDNVRRFVKYLLASNTGELFVLLATQLIAGMTLPLTTLQILWMNLITDGIPALALGVEQSERGAMNRAPYAPNESIFGRGLGRHIVIVGLTLGLTGIGLGYWAFSNNVLAANGNPAWNTMVFFFLTVAQMGHALALRSHRESTFTMNIMGNKFLLGAVVVTVIVQLGAVYLPFFNDIFNTNPLTLEQLLICSVLSTVVFIAAEIEKLLIRRGVLK